jgi:hypothetical protein
MPNSRFRLVRSSTGVQPGCLENERDPFYPIQKVINWKEYNTKTVKKQGVYIVRNE